MAVRWKTGEERGGAHRSAQNTVDLVMLVMTGSWRMNMRR